MKINELKAGATNINIQAKVQKKDEPREVVTKYGKRVSVANITLKDETGTIQMSLWGDDISKVSKGDVIEITNGYVSEFRGSPQLSSGKFGKINVIEKGSGDEETADAEEYDSADQVPEE